MPELVIDMSDEKRKAAPEPDHMSKRNPKARHYNHHGMTGSPEYTAWRAMLERCNNPKNPNYPRYGGRGISVCNQWQESFPAFLSEVGPRPSDGKYSLDRIDNNGNYEPGNVRWATRLTQQQNLRSNRNVTHQGKTMCVRAWARHLGVNLKTIEQRLERGWSPERAVTTPVRPMRRPGAAA